MVGNIDDSTRSESNHLLFRRLFLETVDLQDAEKKCSKNDKGIVGNIDKFSGVMESRW